MPPADSMPKPRLVRWHGRREGVPSHVAPVSLHYGVAGRELYQTLDGRHVVEPGRLLILDAGQQVATFVADRAPTSGASVLFPSAMVQDVQAALAGRLLPDDDPVPAAGPIAERVHAAPAFRLQDLERLRNEDAVEPGREEVFHRVLEAALRLDSEAARASSRVPAVRASTRIELYRRLHRARDFMEASAERPLTLAEIGRVAALSPHRLLQVFPALFGETPQRYLRRLRLERAARLLREDRDRPIGDVASLVGFDSFGSFSWTFRRHFGVTPRDWRRRP